MSDLKIVIIGAGFAARIVHLPGYAGIGAPVAAICDLKQELAQALATEYNIPQVYTDWQEMLEKERPDVVSICLPNVMHKDFALAAFQGGAHVLCEKPLATSVAEAHEMFDAARAAGKVLMAAQHMRFEPGSRALKRVIESGALGEIYHAEANYLRRLGIPTWGVFHQKSASAGGALLDIGVHILDLAMFLMGNPKPVRVSAVTQAKFGKRPEIARIMRGAWDPAKFDVDDFAIAFVRFDHGGDLILRASWAGHIPESREDISILGTEAGITTKPPALYHLRDGFLADEVFKNIPDRRGYTGQARGFLEACRGERESPIPEAETLNVQRILNAAYRSSEEGREVEVEE
ncbi:MAG: Gfo/Idh/MocA family oxidoreductase [Dehalococcoidia bacterium]